MTTTEQPSALVTLLFTDLVGSTELLSRTGDERAQRIFRAHHDLSPSWCPLSARFSPTSPSLRPSSPARSASGSSTP